MSELVQVASRSAKSGWLKDLAALASIGGFIWVAHLWLEFASMAV